MVTVAPEAVSVHPEAHAGLRPNFPMGVHIFNGFSGSSLAFRFFFTPNSAHRIQWGHLGGADPAIFRLVRGRRTCTRLQHGPVIGLQHIRVNARGLRSSTERFHGLVAGSPRRGRQRRLSRTAHGQPPTSGGLMEEGPVHDSQWGDWVKQSPVGHRSRMSPHAPRLDVVHRPPRS